MPNTLRTTFCLRFGSPLWGKRSTFGLWAQQGYAFEFVWHPFRLTLVILTLLCISAALDPAAHVCLLTSDTEVIVAPKSRKKPDTNPTEVDKSEAAGPLACVVRVLPTRLFPEASTMRDDPTVFVSTTTMDKLATQNLKEVYVTCIDVPFKTLLGSLKNSTHSTSTSVENLSLKNLREVTESAPVINGKEESPDPVAVLPLSVLPPNTALVANLSQVHVWGFIRSVCLIILISGTHDMLHRLSSTPPETKFASSSEKHLDSTIPFLL